MIRTNDNNQQSRDLDEQVSDFFREYQLVRNSFNNHTKNEFDALLTNVNEEAKKVNAVAEVAEEVEQHLDSINELLQTSNFEVLRAAGKIFDAFKAEIHKKDTINDLLVRETDALKVEIAKLKREIAFRNAVRFPFPPNQRIEMNEAGERVEANEAMQK
jgi:hydroxymethylpyrimidine pyrophosphatase-like HAD family hydrolase